MEYNPENIFRTIYISERDISCGAHAILRGFFEAFPQEKRTVDMFRRCAKRAENSVLNELPLIMPDDESIESVGMKSIDSTDKKENRRDR